MTLTLSDVARRRVSLTLLGLAIATYIGLSASQISLPGPYYDEALQAPAAIALLSGNGDHIGIGMTVGRWRLPIMAGEYIGALKSYALLPLFFLLGPGTAALRLTTILMTVLGLFFTARFAKDALGHGPAIVGTWLIATDPTFVLATRSDWGPIAIAFTLRMSALYFGFRWWKSRGEDKVALVIASILLGLGMWDKASFIWFVIAIVGIGMVAFLLTRERPQLSPLMLILAVLGFSLGAAPLLSYNIWQDWMTFKLAVLPGEEASIAKLIALIPSRTGALRAVFDAQALAHWMTGIHLKANLGITLSLLGPLSLTALIVLAVAAARRRRAWLAFFPVITLVMLAEMYATPRPIWIHHFIGIYPFPHLAIGVVVGLVWQSVSRSGGRAIVVAVTVIAVIAIVFNLMTMVQFHDALKTRGGSDSWSDAVYPMARTAEEQFARRQIQILDWGMFNQLYLLGGGKLRLSEPIYSLPQTGEPDARMLQLLSDTTNVFLLHSAKATSLENLTQGLEKAARVVGVVSKRERQIRDRNGEVVFRFVEYGRPEPVGR